MANYHWLQLSLTAGLGPVTLQRIMERVGSAEAVCNASLALLRSVEGIGSLTADKIARGLSEAARQVPGQMEEAAKRNMAVICPDDPQYPPLLKNIPDPPAVLFVRGDLQDRDLNGIAIVGSRGCSLYGKEQANRFGASLAAIGFTVVSGGARGIDSSAHRGALSHPAGRTIAVLGCGLDIAYPPENDKLFEEIAQRGAVISEYPFGTPPLAENFPRRNRIVSGMTRGVLLVEADQRSGALITARMACEQDRPVYAIPGRVDNKLSSGPHQLIRDGAVLVTCLADIVEDLPPLPAELHAPPAAVPEGSLFAAPAAAPAPQVKANIPLSEQQSRIIAALGDDTASVDELIDRTTLPAHLILQELTMLSLKGMVARVDGQSYRRK